MLKETTHSLAEVPPSESNGGRSAPPNRHLIRRLNCSRANSCKGLCSSPSLRRAQSTDLKNGCSCSSEC